MGKKYYVVWDGVESGVFDSWEECEAMTKGFPGARYKSFKSLEAAIAAYRGTDEENMDLLKAIASHDSKKVNYEAFPEIDRGAVAVDAACSGNPGDMEYRGVDMATGEELFHVGPLPGGTNNIGEFLAIIHALALLPTLGRPNTTIYSDSKTGMAWVRNRFPRTSLAPNTVNRKVMELLSRATKWIQTHNPTNPLVRWKTEEWGEIPADFGRK